MCNLIASSQCNFFFAFLLAWCSYSFYCSPLICHIHYSRLVYIVVHRFTIYASFMLHKSVIIEPGYFFTFYTTFQVVHLLGYSALLSLSLERKSLYRFFIEVFYFLWMYFMCKVLCREVLVGLEIWSFAF